MRTALLWPRRWSDLSISKKLYLVVGIMAILIAAELLTLSYALQTLSAVRAFVVGEALWSKAQKNAAFSIQRYAMTRDEADYQDFLKDLEVPAGDHAARLELFRPHPDLQVVWAGFKRGRIHPDDIHSIVLLLQRFYWEPHISEAIRHWTVADELLEEFRDEGHRYYAALRSDPKASARVDPGGRGEVSLISARLRELNERMTLAEEGFSDVLSSGARWLEHLVVSILFFAVLTVECVGLTLTFLTSRRLSRGLSELNEAASRYGQNEFGQQLVIGSRDEIGSLAQALNHMGLLLQQSYSELEARVLERTGELEVVARENRRLYEHAESAVRLRDEFLSIASHELRTPLTALKLQMQLLKRTISSSATETSFEEHLKRLEQMADGGIIQARRLASLADELLDLTHFQLGQFKLDCFRADISALVKEVVAQFTLEATRLKVELGFFASGEVFATVDPIRIGQVVTNLISNALKYGRARPVSVRVEERAGEAVISVADRGDGIPEDQQERIFERFARVRDQAHLPGLGLGLFITRKIVQAHGGRIQLISQPGEGTIFEVFLPMS